MRYDHCIKVSFGSSFKANEFALVRSHFIGYIFSSQTLNRDRTNGSALADKACIWALSGLFTGLLTPPDLFSLRLQSFPPLKDKLLNDPWQINEYERIQGKDWFSFCCWGRQQKLPLGFCVHHHCCNSTGPNFNNIRMENKHSTTKADSSSKFWTCREETSVMLCCRVPLTCQGSFFINSLQRHLNHKHRYFSFYSWAVGWG